MYKAMLSLLIGGLASIGIAIADDMDGNNVIRAEHTASAQAEQSADNHRAAQDTENWHGGEEGLLSAEHSQDIISARVDAMESGSGPDTLELDSLGLYFGLGEHFVDMANGTIDARQNGYSERGGYPVYSRLSDGTLAETSADHETAGHNHGSDSGDDGESEDGYGLNRRDADHDYFYD